MTGLTVDQFAARASQNVRRRLIEGDAFTVENEEDLPDSATP